MRKLYSIISLIIIFTSIFLYINKSPYWYQLLTIAMWLIFDNLSSLRKNKTTLDLILTKNYKKFLIIYITLAISGSLIEIIGNAIFDFWSYQYLTTTTLIITAPIFYPFILLSFKESYSFLSSLLKNKTILLITTMVVNMIIWELPNIYSQDWIYSIPYVKTEIFHINILIILSWTILILLPVYICRFIDKTFPDKKLKRLINKN